MNKRAGGSTTATLTLVPRPICTPQMPPATPRTKCFNQLHHPHSPGSRATKRLSSCPQRTVRLMCLSTLQDPGWAGRGRRQGEGKWQVAPTQESEEALLAQEPQVPAPLSPPWLEKGRGEETGEQVPAAGEAAAAVSFPNKYTSLPSWKRGGHRGWGGEGQGEAATCVAWIKAEMRWCQNPLPLSSPRPPPHVFLKLLKSF